MTRRLSTPTVAERDVIDIEGLIPLDQLQAQQTQLARIETAEEAQAAGLYLRAVRQSIRNIKQHYKEVRKPVRDALKDLTRQEEEKLAPFEAAERAVDAPLIAWQVADRQRVEQERQAQLARARAAEEAKRAAEVAQLKEQAASAKGLNKTLLKAQAKALEAAPVRPTVNEPLPEATKIEGVSLREYWHAEVDDFVALVDAVAKGRVPVSALQPNQEWLDEQADALRMELHYPGVSAHKTHGQTARGV